MLYLPPLPLVCTLNLALTPPCVYPKSCVTVAVCTLYVVLNICDDATGGVPGCFPQHAPRIQNQVRRPDQMVTTHTHTPDRLQCTVDDLLMYYMH